MSEHDSSVAERGARASSSPQQRPQQQLSFAEREASIALLQQLVKFPTTSHAASQTGAYNDCAAYLVYELQFAGIDDAHILRESLPNKPIVVASIPGLDPDLPGILLNSHVDVVPVIQEDWTMPAFEGLRKDGNIYGRGTQDMKCVCAQYITALRHLIRSGRRFRRTIYLSFVPDEEIGGIDGMNILMQSDWFHEKGGKVEIVLDEGLASEGDNFNVFYGERLPWFLFFDSVGNTGHGSRFIDGTAVSSAYTVMQRALAFRESQRRLLHGLHSADENGCSHVVAAKKSLGDVTSLNITVLQAGTTFPDGRAVMNVVPGSARVGMDIRIAPHDDPTTIASMLDSWCQEINSTPGSASTEWSYAFPCVQEHKLTQLDDKTVSPWWDHFRTTLLQGFGVAVEPAVFPAATDSRFLRAHGYKALGFSPIRRSPILLHENDEYLSEEAFLEGCEIYLVLLPALADFVP